MVMVRMNICMLSYQKGGSVIRMMEAIITRGTFNWGLTQYLTDLSYRYLTAQYPVPPLVPLLHSAATEDDLFSHLEAAAMEDGEWPASNKPFPEVMKSWTNQAGLPVVQVARNTSHLTFTQVQGRWRCLCGC